VKSPVLKRCSPRLQAKKDAGTSLGLKANIERLVEPTDPCQDLEQENTIVESPVLLKQRKSIRIEKMIIRQPTLQTESQSCQELQEEYIVPDTPESPVITRRRKSMRIEEITNRQSIINVTHQPEKIRIKRKSTRLSLKSYRLDSSISSTQLTLSPSMAEFLKDMSFNGPSSSRRNSVSSIALSDASQQTSPDLSQMQRARCFLAPPRPARKSLSVGNGSRYSMIEENSQQNINCTRKRRKSRIALLEEELMAKSPSQASAQDKHNRKILKMLNGSLKTLQQLPTVGPKTSFIIFNYRFVFNSIN
jgi:DNA uptake protein ComE-like DNA-binding protein